ncbi:MAG: single-stranded DNA-binding protein [Caldilineaceae bacterium]|nr:single-stranded DNA-binding protein [Caldilineaceae bacterium]MCB0098171.1 single-stranded DNA-binding protein [Caldilineaceae bacterium]
MYQQLTLIGHLGADPVMRYTPSGVSVTTFRLAVNRYWTNSDGQSQERTTWFNVTAWNRLAETTNQYLNKGQQVCVVGEVEDARPWTDREGNLRASIEVRAREVKFLSGRAEGNSSAESDLQVEEPVLEGAEVPF